MNNTSTILDDKRAYSHVFEFERQFRYKDAINWMEKNWTIAYYVVALYLVLLFWGHRHMTSRPRLEIRGVLFIWNLVLAIFSIVATLRSIPELHSTISRYGFEYSICGHCEKGCTSVGQFWLFAFALSKVVELGDTFFVVARKQPLYFLHWYHHVTVLLYTWQSYATSSSSGRWFFFLNISVHSMMYTYYTLKSLSISVPRSVSMTITVAQLSQMVLGCYITYYVYHAKRRGASCLVDDANLRASALMYASYFCLFLWYFYQTYFAKTSMKRKSVKKQD